MKLMNIAYTNDMHASVAFFDKLGLQRDQPDAISDWWNQYSVGDATLALHWNQGNELPTSSNPELHFTVGDGELDRLYAQLDADGADLEGEIFQLDGMPTRTFVVRDPSGIRVQING